MSIEGNPLQVVWPKPWLASEFEKAGCTVTIDSGLSPVKQDGPIWCLVSDCALRAVRRGWCNAHYRRWLRYGDPLGGGLSKGGALKYLNEQISRETDDCILWPHGQTTDGYGSMWDGTSVRRVHQVACEVVHGPAPVGKPYACHGPCHNPLCFNPRHVTWGTPTQNNLDRVRDGTMPRGEGHSSARLSESQVREIRVLSKQGDSLSDLAKKYTVSKSCIAGIVARRRWDHV